MQLSETRDNIYANPIHEVSAFKFDEKVVRVFEDMISRSVPGYKMTVTQMGLIAAKAVSPNSQCYDLGCSLGAGILSMSQQIKEPNCKIIGVDSSEAMLKQCRTLLERADLNIPWELRCEDIRTTPIENASFVALNFTLQFIPPNERNALLDRILDGMNTGGMLILSEKICFEEKQTDEILTELHHDFKRANGYSDLEIAQKRSSLENVLLPESLKVHRQRLLDVGFRTVVPWLQCFNFMSIIAVK